MRGFVVLSAMVALVGCNAVDPGAAPTKVSWAYGAGNGDGVAYPGPKPVFRRANGLESDAVAPPATEPRVAYGWGAENVTNGTMQVTPEAQQKVASPAPSQHPAPNGDEHGAAPGTHS